MTVTEAVLPAVTEAGVPVSVSVAAAPGTVVKPLVVPLWEPSSPVTVWVVPATVEVVKLTVATPEPLVVEVGEPNEPPAPVFDQVTVRPLVETALLLASASCAVIVTALPATGLEELDVTRYCVAGPGTVVKPLVVPLWEPSSPVTVWVVPATVEVVKLTVATPEPLVVEVGEPNEPPAPVFDQVTVRPLVETALLLASASCAVIVTALPATGLEELDVTRYCVAAPGVKVTEAELAIAEPLRVPVIEAVPAVVEEVRVAV